MDPRSIVSCERAGMQSIVFTSKHHDVFACISRFTDFNIGKHTYVGTYERAGEACKKRRIGFGVIIAVDWP